MAEAATGEENLEELIQKFANKLDSDNTQLRTGGHNKNNAKEEIVMEVTTCKGELKVHEPESQSLMSLMSEFAEKLEQDSQKLTMEVKQVNEKTDNHSIEDPALASLLSKVADRLDTQREDISGTHSSSDTTQESLQGMLKDLHKQIKTSDWLHHNTAEKWVSENPKLAADYMEAVSKATSTDIN